MQMQAIKQNQEENKQCKRHASDKAKQGAENSVKCGKQCKAWKTKQRAENDAKGHRKLCSGARNDAKCGKRGKAQKTRQSGVQNQNKGVGNMHRGRSKPKK